MQKITITFEDMNGDAYSGIQSCSYLREYDIEFDDLFFHWLANSFGALGASSVKNQIEEHILNIDT